jgi:multicomponent Na+:H+ antiporter subunit F
VSGWLVFSAVLLVGGLAPALYLGARGTGVARLAGLQLAGSVTVLLLVALSVVFGQPSYLIVPLALVLLAYAGTLVFTRLLSR